MATKKKTTKKTAPVLESPQTANVNKDEVPLFIGGHDLIVKFTADEIQALDAHFIVLCGKDTAQLMTHNPAAFLFIYGVLWQGLSASYRENTGRVLPIGLVQDWVSQDRSRLNEFRACAMNAYGLATAVDRKVWLAHATALYEALELSAKEPEKPPDPIAGVSGRRSLGLKSPEPGEDSQSGAAE